ncbi:CBS domain-containing protein [bacterium]|nr:CBS domain-containing protein [bacterium]
MVPKLTPETFSILGTLTNHLSVRWLVEYGILIIIVYVTQRILRAKHRRLPIPLPIHPRKFTIRDLILTEYDSIHEETPFRQIIELVKYSDNIDFPVVDNERCFLGLVSFNDLRNVLWQSHLYSNICAKDVMNTYVKVLKPDDSLEDAMMKFEKQNTDLLPVVDSDDSMQLLGIVKLSDLMKKSWNIYMSK